MKKNTLLLLSSLFMSLAALSAYVAPCVLAYQCFLWLRDGFWTEYPIWLALETIGMGWPHVQYVGVQKIFDFIVGLPTFIGLLFILPSLLIVGALALEQAASDLPDEEKSHL